jgi:hypothetical protein
MQCGGGWEEETAVKRSTVKTDELKKLLQKNLWRKMCNKTSSFHEVKHLWPHVCILSTGKLEGNNKEWFL